MVETIRLRGHHLAVFANYLLRSAKEVDLTPRYNDSLIGFQPKKDFKKEGIIPREELFSNQGLDVITSQYSPEMKQKIDRTWKTLEMIPEMQVEIVGGVDTICHGCPRYRFECNMGSPEDEDSTTLQDYDLQVGQTITSQDLMQRIRGFYMRTGFHSPRNKMIALTKLQNPGMFI